MYRTYYYFRINKVSNENFFMLSDLFKNTLAV